MTHQFKLVDDEYLSEYLSEESMERHRQILEKKKNTKYFIKGPIDLNWAQQAMESKYKRPLVVLLLLFYSGLNKGGAFYVPSSLLEDWDISSKTYNLIINKLAEQGLIEIVQKGSGSKTRIKLLLPATS